MNHIKEHLPLLLMASDPEKNNPVLKKEIATTRHEQITKPLFFIATSTSGIIAGAEKIKHKISAYLKKHRLDADIIETGSLGLHTADPTVGIQLPNKNRLFFGNISENNVSKLIDLSLKKKIPDGNILGQHPIPGAKPWDNVPYISQHTFFKHQHKTLTKRIGLTSPDNIDEYITDNGYRAFASIISSYTSEEICLLIKKSKLVDRNGKTEPTAEKWMKILEQPGKPKYVICNVFNNGPGGLTDKYLLEGDPHQIIEGIAITAYAIQAGNAIIYLPFNFQKTYERINKAVQQAHDYGILGENILNSGFDLHIDIKTCPGTYICNEETALIASLEGKRAQPVQQPPPPEEQKLFGKPTLVHDPETLANVTHIVQNGYENYAKTGNSIIPGTKLVSVAGKTKYGGIVEVDTNMLLANVVKMCNKNINSIKAIHMAGHSGATLKVDKINIPLNNLAMKKNGINLINSNILILDKTNCIISLTRYFMGFVQKESCGKCIPCREGSQRIFDILTCISHPECTETTEQYACIEHLETIAKLMEETSLCNLGKDAGRLVLASLNNFKEEYDQHVFHKFCSAKTCFDKNTTW